MEASTAGLFMGAASVGTNLLGAMSAGKSAGFEQEQIAEQQRLAKAMAIQSEVDAFEKLARVKATARAKAASGNVDPSSRSFMALMKDNDRLFNRDLLNIRVNAKSKQKIYSTQMKAAQSKSTTGVTRGLLAATSSGITGYRDYKKGEY